MSAVPEEKPAAPVVTDSPYGEPATQRRNFYAWILYQFFYRIGWQFKMESTLMAGVVSYLTGSPSMMGLFTMMNSIVRNLSPLIAAPIVDRFQYKRRALLFFWGATVIVWGVLSVYLWLPSANNRAVSIWVFGVCYTLFFALLGTVAVAQGALLGKIIPAEMRGRAMAVGMTFSGFINVATILAVYHFIRQGGFPEPRNYALSFTLTSGLFLLAGVSLFAVRESPSVTTVRPFNLKENLRHFVRLGRENRNLSRLMVVNLTLALGGSMLQFYTGYWRKAGTMTAGALMLATVLQVFWQCLSSSILGRVADVRGNRVIICSLLWIEGLIPLAALVLGGWEPFRSHWGWFMGVYSLVGLRFPLYQLLVNYLLEIVPQEEHAMALGAVNTVQLVTAPAPLILGAMAGAWGYPVAFIAGALVMFYGAWVALGLKEVRVKRR